MEKGTFSGKMRGSCRRRQSENIREQRTCLEDAAVIVVLFIFSLILLLLLLLLQLLVTEVEEMPPFVVTFVVTLSL